MSGKRAPTARHAVTGFTLPELMVVLAIIALMVAILFPRFQSPPVPPNGAVRDSLGKPIPGAILRFRDSSGHFITTVTADGYGSFRAKGLEALSKNAVDGFGLTRAQHRTGSPNLYTYTPLGTQVATFRDEAGKPVAGLAVSFEPAPFTWQHYPLEDAFQPTTDKRGTARLTNVPSGARLLIQSNDPHYVVENVKTSVSGNTIRYEATVARLNTQASGHFSARTSADTP